MSKLAPAAILNGTAYIAGFSLENSSKVTVSTSYEEKTLPNYQGGGGNDDSFKRLTACTIALDARNVSLKTLEVAFGGTGTAILATAITGEAHVAGEPGALIEIDSLQDMSASLVVEDSASGVLAEGVDYIRKRGGIIPIEGGGITKGDDLTFDYTRNKGAILQALLRSAWEADLFFDGINERDGQPWIGKFFRVNWSPADNFELIGDDFATFSISGEVLRDETRTGVGESQFFEIRVGSLN
ncbi:MAG: hypothetical protein LBS89_02110 [Zoogloeaceae bacterium]|jgi:hypothetical protein|nr:hypothetical protein [Zoogloeaceae bacterium]